MNRTASHPVPVTLAQHLRPYLATVVLAAVLLVNGAGIQAASAAACGGGKQATALIYDDIEIDGDLSDWPLDLVDYAVSGTPPATFRVVYSPAKDRIFVAVVVRTDDDDVGNRWDDTDAVEIYTWGGDPGGDRPCQPRGGSRNPVQFAYVPGHGSYIPGCGNPCGTVGGRSRDAAAKGVEVVHQRRGDRVMYEWAVPVFADYGRMPVDLDDAGRAIGFDLVVVDKYDGGLRWVPWGNRSTQKYLGPERVSTLVLSPARARTPSLIRRAVAGGNLGHLLLFGVGAMAAIGGGLALRTAGQGRSRAVRLGELEQRMTDTQDVLLALSDKCDRLERRLDELQPPPGMARPAQDA